MSRIIVYNDKHVIFEGALLSGEDFIQTADLGAFVTQLGLLVPVGDYSCVMSCAFRGFESIPRPEGMDANRDHRLVRLSPDNMPRTGVFSGVLFNPFWADPFVVRIIGYGDYTNLVKSTLVASFTDNWRVLYRGDPVQDEAIAFALKDAETTEEVVSILNEILPFKPHKPITFNYRSWLNDMRERAKEDKTLFYFLSNYKYVWPK